MKIYKLLIIIAFCSIEGLAGQDLHFSNPQLFQSYFNPALTGGEVDQWTIGLQHRSQWPSINQGFQTAAVFLEKKKNRLGYGGQFYQNKAGESSLKTIGGKGTFGYSQPLSNGKNFLQAGASLGFLQKSFNTSVLTFDEQFVEGVGFDSSLENGERFSETTSVVIDGSVGLIWKGEFGTTKKINATIGGALHNFHLPKEGFLTNEKLPMKRVFQGQLDIPLKTKTDFKPFIFYQEQGVQKEMLLAANFSKKVNQDCEIELGIGNRLNDAWVIMGALQWGNTKLIAAYDFNFSNLKPVTNSRGAIEIGLKMNFDLAKKGLAISDESKREMILKNSQSTFSKSVSVDKPKTSKNQKEFYTDSDNDGVRDIDDDCPNLEGSVRNNGCPIGFKDTDRDGVPDDKDYCIHIKGSEEFNGCPDTDEDGVSDIDDKCPYLKGTRELKGCPE